MPVPAEYIFRIGVTYVKTAADVNEITADDLAQKKWRDAYKDFKPNIRTHLKGQQNGRCAFCRCYINLGGSYANLEHLISKKTYPQFKTLPSNLVYCCWICNKSKSRKNTIKTPHADKAQQVFPTTSAGFKIINPYYDDYQDHIDFIDDVIIITQGNSTKGEKTIEYYKLARPELAEDRAREFKLDQQTVNQQLLVRLTLNSIDQNTKNQINAIIAQMPAWTI